MNKASIETIFAHSRGNGSFYLVTMKRFGFDGMTYSLWRKAALQNDITLRCVYLLSCKIWSEIETKHWIAEFTDC